MSRLRLIAIPRCPRPYRKSESNSESRRTRFRRLERDVVCPAGPAEAEQHATRCRGEAASKRQRQRLHRTRCGVKRAGGRPARQKDLVASIRPRYPAVPFPYEGDPNR
jgi:hypothetical protein